MRVGFIGLGNVGSKLAESLLRNGFDMVVRDLDRSAAARLEADGAGWADSPAEMAAEVDVIITCLPSPAISAAVMEADDGILAGLAPRADGCDGVIWAEMSTTDEAEVRRLAGLVTTAGGSAVDCPVSGRVSSGRHRQHLQLRRVRPVYFRADPACPGHHGPPHSAHRSGGLSLDPQGGHQLPGHRQPGVPVRSFDHVPAVRHRPEHCLRGYPHLVGQLVRSRDRDPGGPQRQPQHQLHHGLSQKRLVAVRVRRPTGAACPWNWRRCWSTYSTMPQFATGTENGPQT